MAVALKIPEVGESITEVEIGEWLKSVGDNVERDEDVVIIETEKATVQIAAPQSGTISKILKQSGEKAKVGEIIGQLEEGQVETGTQPRKTAPEKQAPEPVDILPDAEKEKEIDKTAAEAENASFNTAPESERRTQILTIRSSPDAKLPKERERPLAGRPEIREVPRPEPKPESDRSAVARQPEQVGRGVNAQSPAEGARGTIEEPSGREEKAVPMSALRRRIAERLVQAQHAAALLTTFNEIDMAAVIELRERYRESFQQKYNVKLGFMSFFVKAAIEALKRVPAVNAEIRDDEIVYRNFYDVGVAVGGGKGLVVPVIRNTERLSFAELESAIADFAQRARENRLKPDELTGGTFTISNGGVYGSLLSTPIVNPPQSGILGMHAIQDRPVVRQGAVAIRPMMYVALTYDHRLVDGREAVTFLKHIKDFVEEPLRILLEV